MIRYTLRCPDDHSFESWFQSAEAFDKLHAAGMVACAVCGASSVEKAIMAPRVTTARSRQPAPASAAPSTDATVSEAAEKIAHLHRMMTQLRETLEKNATYVGGSFAKEARDQYLGDAPERAIWGEANAKEAKALIEDGIPVAPLPFVPKQKTN